MDYVKNKLYVKVKKIIKDKYSYSSFFEFSLLFTMLITLIIPSISTSIVSWSEISPLLFVRAFVWLLGLLLLPGFYILKFSEIGEKLSKLEKIVIGINLSFVLLCLVSIILFYLQGSIIFLPLFLLAILMILAYFNLHIYTDNQLVWNIKISKWDVLLSIGVLLTILLAFNFQKGQRYLLPGDVWVSLKPAVQIISERNIYETFRHTHYPLMFGHILASLSICSGLPIVNTYAMLFPLASLNILSVFIFFKIVFDLNDKEATVASTIYGFGAGLGLLVQFVGYGGTLSFLSLSRLTNDLSLPNISTVLFYHKSLALTQAFTSIVVLKLATDLEKKSIKIFAILISILLFLFSFYIHMIEALIFMPMILIILYVHEKKRRIYSIFYILIAFIFTLIIDFIMEGYYLWLTSYKINAILSNIGTQKLFTYSIIILGIFSLLLMFIYIHSNNLIDYSSYKYLGLIKVILILVLLIIYLFGLWFWKIRAPTSSFPWYRYITRYGFFGVLAFIGIAKIKWSDKKFMKLCLWGLYIIVLGQLWWEGRIIGYLTPIIVVFSSLGFFEVWEKGHNSYRFNIMLDDNSARKTYTLNPKPITVLFVVSIILFSTISTIYGATNYYGWNNPSVSDDIARAFNWINENVPDNATVLVPNIYNIYRGVETISDRKFFRIDKLPVSLGSDLIETLYNHNIRYVITIEKEISTILEVITSYSTLDFKSGDVKIHKVPYFRSPPSEGSQVAVVNRQLLGFIGDSREIVWIDDDFNEGWIYRRVNASTNGEVLSFRWQLQELYESEPYAIKNISQVDTDRYPYLFIKYRNTADSKIVSQIITVLDEEGYRTGWWKNLALPISKTDTFRQFIEKLPENQTVNEIWIWMRNWNNITGTTDLEIDYIGFSSNESLPDSQPNINFLAMAIPALWPTNYSVYHDFKDVRNSSIVVSIYDKNVMQYIDKSANTNTFVFINSTTSFPLWGKEWKKDKIGLITGNVNGKKVIIVGLESFDFIDVNNLAELIYEEIR